MAFRQLLKTLEVDRAVAYAVAARGWQVLAGPVTMLLIARFLPQETQGYFYTFGSVLTLQMFFELGLQTVLVNLVAHEWAHLKLEPNGTISGDALAGSRLASLLKFVDRWYSICALMFVVVTGVSGFYFFRSHNSDIEWQAPWWCLTVLTGLSLRLIPRMALLEGCHQMRAVNAVRFWQGVCGNAAVWTAIACHAGLWTAVVSGAVRLAFETWLVEVRFRQLRRGVQALAGEHPISWRDEIWPLQWRIALQGLGYWAANNLFNPLMFQYHGAVVAGQMGMTLTLITAIQTAGAAWLSTRVPVFSELVSKRRFAELDRLLKRLTLVSLGFTAVAAAGVLLGIVGLQAIAPKLADRLLPVGPTAVLFGGALVIQILTPQAYNVRAHRIDPFCLLATIAYSATGCAVWYWGSKNGPLGAALAHLLTLGLCYLPPHTWIWWRVRRELQVDAEDDVMKS